MVAFKLLLSLALFSVAFAADVPQIPQATVKLSGPGLGNTELGKPFLLTCAFNATLPKTTEDNMYEWHAEVSFFRGVGTVKVEEVFGTYKTDGTMMNYVTENLYEGINVYPATNTAMDSNMKMRTEFSVVVLVTEPLMSMGTGFQCAVKLHQNYKQAVVRYTSNALKYTNM